MANDIFKTDKMNPSQKCLLAQYLCWCLVFNPRHTTVCLRLKTKPRRDLEPKSYFWDGFIW